MFMGASSSSPVIQGATALDERVIALMNTIDSLAGLDPKQMLSRCSAETRAAVQSEVNAYMQYAGLVQNQRNRVSGRKMLGERQTLEQMELLREHYRAALVRFVIATETGLTLFPIVASHVVDTADIVDAHIKRMNETLAAMVKVVGNESATTQQQDIELRKALQQQISQLVQYNDKVKERMKDIEGSLQV